MRKWRLQPGKMLLIDLEQGRIDRRRRAQGQHRQRQALRAVDREPAHASWTSIGRSQPPAPRRPSCRCSTCQQAFGYTQEDIKFLLTPMAANGEEGIGSMGNDSPLAVLSDKNKPLYTLLPPAVRPGDQPAHRPDPRSDGDVAGVASSAPSPTCWTSTRSTRRMRLEVSQPVLDCRRHGPAARYRAATDGKFNAAATIDITYPLRLGREGVEAQAGLAVRRRPWTPSRVVPTS